MTRRHGNKSRQDQEQTGTDSRHRQNDGTCRPVRELCLCLCAEIWIIFEEPQLERGGRETEKVDERLWCGSGWSNGPWMGGNYCRAEG
jgi:hypothetical protein